MNFQTPVFLIKSYSMIFGTAYLISDIVDYYITGMDRITAQILIYQ